METPVALALWIADASVPGAQAERRAALRNGYELARTAATEGAIEPSPQGYARFAQFFRQLADDGWLQFDYQQWPQDPDPPPAWAFTEQHLQRADNVRLTPEGWRAVSAVRARPLVEPTAQAGDEMRHFFISHASEDKEAVARPLAEELVRRGWRVWFDKFEFTAGDSLRRKIDGGLRLSRFGVVVLSPSFFAKEWPQRELDGLAAKETESGQKVIIPIWHEVDTATVVEFSAPLADKLGLPSEMGAEALADELERVLAAGGEPIGAAAAERAAARPRAVDADFGRARESRVLAALLDQNPVRTKEMLRGVRLECLAPIDEAISGRHNERMTDETLSELDAVLRRAMAPLAAELLPLVDHAPEELYEQLTALGDWAGRAPEGGYTAWNEVPRFACWCVGHILGTYATRVRAFRAAGALVRATVTTGFGQVEPLIDGVPGSFGHGLASAAVAPPPGGRKWIAPEWEYVRELFESAQTLQEAAADVLTKSDDPKRAMGDWSFVHCLGLGLREVRSAAYFSVSDGGARDFALRLNRDDALRARLASDAFGIDMTELDERARQALSHARGLGMFHDMDAVSIYLTGSI